MKKILAAIMDRCVVAVNQCRLVQSERGQAFFSTPNMEHGVCSSIPRGPASILVTGHSLKAQKSRFYDIMISHSTYEALNVISSKYMKIYQSRYTIIVSKSVLIYIACLGFLC